MKILFIIDFLKFAPSLMGAKTKIFPPRGEPKKISGLWPDFFLSPPLTKTLLRRWHARTRTRTHARARTRTSTHAQHTHHATLQQYQRPHDYFRWPIRL